ncbi:MAG: VanZ family protein [Ruminococcus sp.]|nr:VanZ family protein [Ruminococcus sp.]
MFSPMKTLYTYFPLTFFLRIAFLLLIDIVAAVIVYKLWKKNRITKNKALAIQLLVMYVTVVLFLTVLCRRTLEYHRFGVDVVSYYSSLFCGTGEVDVTELVLNIGLFIPVGFLSCYVFSKYKIICAVLFSAFLSSMIELSQYVLRNGYVSFTDVIHNTVGSLLGAVLMALLILIHKIITKKSEKDG